MEEQGLGQRKIKIDHRAGQNLQEKQIRTDLIMYDIMVLSSGFYRKLK